MLFNLRKAKISKILQNHLTDLSSAFTEKFVIYNNPGIHVDEFNPFKHKSLEWYSPCLDLGHNIQVCRDERVSNF